MRRSTDGGVTWSAPATAAASGSTNTTYVTVGDAMPLYDSDTGRVFLFFTRNNRDLFLQHSDDAGTTWSPRVNLTAQLKRPQSSGWIGSGHANGLQLAPSGRLAAPLYTNKSYLVFSSDHGATWAPGGGVPGVKGNEWDAAPIGKPGSGLLLANVRSPGDTLSDLHRYLANSTDGGTSWGEAVPNDDLPSPLDGCEGATIRHPNGALYYSGPSKPPLREVMMIKKSVDDGATWQDHLTVWDKAAGYSSMVVMDPTTASSDIGLLYDRNNATMIIFEAQAVSFTAFSP